MSSKIFWGVLAIIVIAFFAFIFMHHGSKTQPTQKKVDNLSSLNTGPAPWPVESEHLTDRMQAIGLSLLSEEGTAQHIHSHLDIYIHGKHTAVPADIGIISTGISPVHTHDTSGIIHIESDDANATYTLGQVFTLWGVKFTNNSIGSYKNDPDNKLTVYDNGVVVSDPVNLKLAKHHEIVVVYGTTAEKPSIPKSYTFTNGL